MTRSRLPNKRQHEMIPFTHKGIKIFAGFGRGEDGAITELFIDAGKVGSAVNTMARDAAVILSIALQYGTPLSVIVDALDKEPDGEPAGPVGQALKLATDHQ